MNEKLSRKYVVSVIRLLVAIILAYFVIFSTDPVQEHAGYAFIAFYLATCLAVLYLPERIFHDNKLFYILVLFDTLMIGVGIYLSGMAGTDLYLIYFFIICLAALGAKFEYFMVSVLVFVGVYGWSLYAQGYLSGDMAVGYLLRLPFIVAIALLFGFLATTVLHESNKRLDETERQYRLLFDYSDIFVFTVNPAGELLSANQKLYLAYGFSSEIEILGMPYAELHDKHETEVFMQSLSTVFETGASVEYESYSRKFDRWFVHSLSPIKNPGKDDVFAVGGVSKDITERVKKEEELQRTNKILVETRSQLIQKDKMASLGRLASGIAHEIRNPMEIILMGLDYIEGAAAAGKEIDSESINRIYNAVERVNTIINDILKFSRKAEFVLEKVDVCAMIDEVLNLTGYHISKNNIHLTKIFPDERLQIAGNKGMLEQVLINLIHNAVDAMDESHVKNLTVRIYRETVADVGYKTGYRNTDYFKIGDQMVIIEIVDSGKGMDQDVLTKLFEPFFTTKETGKGTGLGLSIAHMIIDRIHGTIDVDSQPGEGTTFFVKLQPAENLKILENSMRDEKI